MFEIEYKGANCVVISTKNAKLVTDPNLSIVGLKNTPVKSVVELATEDRFAVDDPGVNLLINGPGEYGIARFDIRGIAARRHIDTEKEGMQATIYRVEIGESRIGILGNIDEKLSDEQLEELGMIDVLIIPVGGGGYTLDATGAAGLVKSISPKVVIPVHYADKTLRYEVPQDELSLFVKELGAPVETVSKYKVKQAPGLAGTLSIVEITRS
jgi:L-ascorbate metabolism protein UlaG (beta-lactamase superfamily)